MVHLQGLKKLRVGCYLLAAGVDFRRFSFVFCLFLFFPCVPVSFVYSFSFVILFHYLCSHSERELTWWCTFPAFLGPPSVSLWEEWCGILTATRKWSTIIGWPHRTDQPTHPLLTSYTRTYSTLLDRHAIHCTHNHSTIAALSISLSLLHLIVSSHITHAAARGLCGRWNKADPPRSPAALRQASWQGEEQEAFWPPGCARVQPGIVYNCV